MTWIVTILKLAIEIIGGLFRGSAARQKRLDEGKEKVNEGIDNKDVTDITDGFDRIRNA